MDMSLGSLLLNDTATTEICTLARHDALPIFGPSAPWRPIRSSRSLRIERNDDDQRHRRACDDRGEAHRGARARRLRSEEHTSELQSRQYLVCRLLLEKINKHF